ncbi:MAG: ABC transporter ATP-binding protein [bacterium]
MLRVRKLKTCFTIREKTVSAVDDISFDIAENETLGLVGESGSGKSVTALSILQLLPETAKISAKQLSWQGKNLQIPTTIKAIRGSEIALIFQNPLAALNPVFSIGNQLIETICLHQKCHKEQARKIAIDLLNKVNIPDAEKRLNDYPHQFSLGMCQRVMIAITLGMQPKLLIADEPTASLDVTVQAQILALINQLKKELNMSVLLISHDLGVIAQYCDRILVMYLGKLVEIGTPEQIFGDPKHPYTQALISAIPSTDPSKKHQPTLLKGDIPSPLNRPRGCSFHPRCPKIVDPCTTQEPILKAHKRAEVACWLY